MGTLIVLIIFSSHEGSCIGLLEDDDPLTITFLVLTLLQTFATIIMSTIASINIRKGSQLDLKSKIVLGLSISCQLAARLLVMIPIAVSPDISLTSCLLLLILPIPIGWAITVMVQDKFYPFFWSLSTKDKLIYLLSTTWFTLPVRRIEDRDQRHKGRESFVTLLLTGMNLFITSAIFLNIAANPVPDPSSSWVHILFSLTLVLYTAGCGFLLLFEKTIHPWRHLGKDRERHCWGKLQGTKKGIEVEQTIWEQVKMSFYYILTHFDSVRYTESPDKRPRRKLFSIFFLSMMLWRQKDISRTAQKRLVIVRQMAS